MRTFLQWLEGMSISNNLQGAVGSSGIKKTTLDPKMVAAAANPKVDPRKAMATAEKANKIVQQTSTANPGKNGNNSIEDAATALRFANAMGIDQ